MEKKRDFRIDNIRAVLIFLVVLGHILARVKVPHKQEIYFFIYSFHMPAFIFLSGLCYKEGKWSSLLDLSFSYILFQVLLLAEIAWEEGSGIALQFTTPAWSLWYLLSLILWRLITNFMKIDVISHRGGVILVLSVAAGLLAGYVPSIGYKFSLSRTIVFFPFFLAGVLLKKYGQINTGKHICDGNRALWLRVLLVIPALAAQLLLYSIKDQLSSYFFYGARPYDERYTIAMRAMIYVVASLSILALFMIVPNKKIPLVTYIGQNTMSVYLLHGILLRIAAHCGWLAPFRNKPLYVVLLAAGLVLMLSAPPIAGIFNRIIKPWTLWKRYTEKVKE